MLGCTPPRDPGVRAQGLPVTFAVDDRAGQGFRDGELALHRLPVRPGDRGLALRDALALHDDGPWTEGGHEAEGAVAGDHLWSLTLFARPEPSAQFEYRFLDRSVDPPVVLGPERAVLVVWKGQGPAAAPALVVPPCQAAGAGSDGGGVSSGRGRSGPAAGCRPAPPPR